MTVRPRRSALTAVLLALALGACGGGAVTTQPAGPADDVEGTWTLVSGSGPKGTLTRVDGYPVSLTVAGGKVSGTSACNSYGGDVRRGDGGFVPGALTATEMACTNVRAMDLEAAYLAALGAVTSAAVDGTTLTLTGDGVSLVFGRNAPEPDSPLEGRRWMLDTAVTGDTASTTFGGRLALVGGRLTGNAGCQDLTGAYTVDGGTLVATDVRLVAGPLTDCSVDAVRQDETVREILAARPTVTITGTRLTLTAGDRALSFVDRGTTD